MPMRPNRLCKCGHIVPARTHCSTCTRTYDRARGGASRRGYGARHRRWRSMVMAEHPEGCAQCKAPPKDSDHADHITPIPQPNWWDGDWSIANGQRLCHTCHNRKTVHERMA